jgi:hypothetical protein
VHLLQSPKPPGAPHTLLLLLLAILLVVVVESVRCLGF